MRMHLVKPKGGLHLADCHEDCRTCHGSNGLTVSIKGKSLWFRVATFSPHARAVAAIRLSMRGGKTRQPPLLQHIEPIPMRHSHRRR